MKVSNEVLILIVIIVAVILWLWAGCRVQCKTSSEGMSWPIPIPGNPPPLGDFLPTIGGVRTSGKYELESDNPDVELCRDCTKNCMRWRNGSGYSLGTERDFRECSAACLFQCNPYLA